MLDTKTGHHAWALRLHERAASKLATELGPKAMALSLDT